jgi:hypothetical protein
MLRVICLNWILKQAHVKVVADCKNKQTLRHLAWGTSETPQLSDTKCSFSKKWLIKCSCVDDGLTAHLKPQSGLNLIIASAALILNWLQEAKHHLNSNHQFTKWKIRHTYENHKMNQLVKKLSCEDWSLLEHQPDAEDTSQHLFKQSWTIVIIIKQFYQGHIRDIMQDIVYSPKPLKKQKLPHSWSSIKT